MHPAILRWAIDGCLDWQANGLLRAAAVLVASRAYLEEQDVFTHWVDAECTTGLTDSATHKALFASPVRLRRRQRRASRQRYGLHRADDPGRVQGGAAHPRRQCPARLRGHRPGRVSDLDAPRLVVPVPGPRLTGKETPKVGQIGQAAGLPSYARARVWSECRDPSPTCLLCLWLVWQPSRLLFVAAGQADALGWRGISPKNWRPQVSGSRNL